MLSSVILFASLVLAMPQACSKPRSVPALSVGMKWDYPLGDKDFSIASVNASVPFYSIDMFNNTAETIKQMQDASHYVACYFSAGSYEPYRPDSNEFLPEVIGNNITDFPDENWVDIRSDNVRNIMKSRIDLAVTKGCNGIDPDNIDGYLTDNDPGFPLTTDDAITFVKFMCDYAHSKGLQCGLKNGKEVVPALVDYTDWEINEQCQQFTECDEYRAFIDKGKPIFHVEYIAEDQTSVPDSEYKNLCSPAGFSTVIKHKALEPFSLYCD